MRNGPDPPTGILKGGCSGRAQHRPTARPEGRGRLGGWSKLIQTHSAHYSVARRLYSQRKQLIRHPMTPRRAVLAPIHWSCKPEYRWSVVFVSAVAAHEWMYPVALHAMFRVSTACIHVHISWCWPHGAVCTTGNAYIAVLQEIGTVRKP